MRHPLLHLIATRPQLLAEHAGVYAELLAEDLGALSGAWRRRALLLAAGLCLLLTALVLAGVAALLWAALPSGQLQAPWALFTIPLLPLVSGFGCLRAARPPAGSAGFGNAGRQLQADLAMLREAGAS